MGWRWACPACGTPYNAKLVGKPGLIPANHAWDLETTGQVMLAERPESLEERAINEAATKMAEHAHSLHFTDLSTQDVQLMLGEMVASHSMKADFQLRPLSRKARESVADLNT